MDEINRMVSATDSGAVIMASKKNLVATKELGFVDKSEKIIDVKNDNISTENANNNLSQTIDLLATRVQNLISSQSNGDKSNNTLKDSIFKGIQSTQNNLLSNVKSFLQLIEKHTANYPSLYTFVLITLVLCIPPSVIFLAIIIPTTLIFLFSMLTVFIVLEGLVLSIAGAILFSSLAAICSVCLLSFAMFATGQLVIKKLCVLSSICTEAEMNKKKTK